MDRDGDGLVDILREVHFGHAGNAAKRDLGALDPTTFTEDAWDGLYEGRALLARTAGRALTEDEAAELRGWRDLALSGWEAAIAASVVHYINDTIRDTRAVGAEGYSFADHAKHWSEMKGFALSLQFNRLSPLTKPEHEELHALLDIRPATAAHTPEEREAYVGDLLAARDLLAAAYGFDAANLGDDNGENGW
jgi:hypothetical protein